MNSPLATTETVSPSTSISTGPSTNTGSFAMTQPHLEVTGALGARYDEILTPAALDFVSELHDRFAGTRHDLLATRLR